MLDVVSFWRPCDPNAYLGQWFDSAFELNDVTQKTLPVCFSTLPFLGRMHGRYSSAEQFMMVAKAVLMDDAKSEAIIRKTNNPRTCKRLGRKVQNFDSDKWAAVARDVVCVGNYLKFSQNQHLKKELLGTKTATLVEGSPYDKVWGVGLRYDSPHINQPDKWKGTNLLGNCLESVRELLTQKPVARVKD